MNNYAVLIKEALQELHAAVEELNRAGDGMVPNPRPRVFDFGAGVSWPGRKKDGELTFDMISLLGTNYALCKHCIEHTFTPAFTSSLKQPRLILRALRRIQAATAWCKARAEGKRRAAENIRRQQQKAVDSLDAELVLARLK